MRCRLTALIGAALVAALPVSAWGAPILWTMTASPAVVTDGQVTAFTVTTTNLDPIGRIGCFEVDLTSGFAIKSIGTPVATNGAAWSASMNGDGHSLTVRSSTNAGRLRLAHSVSVVVSAQPSGAGAYLWPNHIHTRRDCTGTNINGLALPVTVLPNIVATPAPSATPTATPTPLPTPLATLLPTVPPLPLPTLFPKTPPPTATPPVGEEPTPRPGEPTPTPDAGGTRPSSSGPEPSPAGIGAGGAPTVQVARLDDGAGGVSDDLGMGLDVMGQLDAGFVWFVPGAAVGVPGILVILFVVAQALGAAAWIPAARRLRDDDASKARPGVSRGA